ncbi:MAG: lipocalin-like domain-containing protein [Thermodesulfobacteriota bacterium]|nr:lipocalin-like domain-containing protein [Thermodesulfobacteriota bacterium]
MISEKKAALVIFLGTSTLVLLLAIHTCLGSEGFLQAVEPRGFTFPKDHGDHPGFQTEWWYYTGNVAGADKRPFGFQLTFFRVQLQAVPVEASSKWRTNQLYFAHLTISDMEAETFLVAEKAGRGAGGIGGVSQEKGRVRVFLHGWETAILGQSHHLKAASDQFGVDLTLVSEKPPIFHGERGLSRKGARQGQASYYYSLTRMGTKGTLQVDGKDVEVSGWSWMDHEFSSNVLSEDQVGWDWMGLQLSDGQELMVYVLRHWDGAFDPFSSGTLVQKDGTSVHLPKETFAIRPTDYWESPRTEARYPSAWQVEVLPHDISLRVVPNLRDQELMTEESTQVTYWEGSAGVTGYVSGQAVTGSGYVELTGYAGDFKGALLW